MSTAQGLASRVIIMKNIKLKIDEATLERVDFLLALKAPRWSSRSEVITFALKRLVEDLGLVNEEEWERETFRRRSVHLNRQAAALINEQATPK